MKSKRTSPQPGAAKIQALRQSGTLNRHANKVQDPLFLEKEFFDPQDLTQVKYEMLRRVQKEAMPIRRVAPRFGFSRPAFYKAQKDFTREGLVGLLPKRRGPKEGHKITGEIVAFVEQRRSQEPSPRMPDLLRQIQEKFGVQVHRRTVERALITAKKKQHAP
jgi:transposase